MKKYLTLLVSVMLIVALIAATNPPQPGKNKDNKQQGKGNSNKGNKGNNGNGNQNGNKDKKDKPDHQKDNVRVDQPGNSGHKGNNGNKSGNGNDDNHKMKDRDLSDRIFRWDRDNFKNRKDLRKQEKVTVCHKFNHSNGDGVTIRVSAHALKAHMGHGDVMGECPAIADNRFSNVFLKNRADYYDVLQNGDEQVVYSKSILEYALERLTGAKQQLVVMRSSNVPVAEIERKQVAVVELEQNVSLLQTLIGVAANLIASKFL